MCATPCLLDQLTFRRALRRLRRLEFARWQLPDPAPGGVPVLTQQAHVLRTIDGHDGRAARMVDDLQVRDVPVGQTDGLDVDADDAALKDTAYGEDAHERRA